MGLPRPSSGAARVFASTEGNAAVKPDKATMRVAANLMKCMVWEVEDVVEGRKEVVVELN